MEKTMQNNLNFFRTSAIGDGHQWMVL